MKSQTITFALILSLLANAAFVIYVLNHHKTYTVPSSQRSAAERLPYLSARILRENPNDTLISFLSLRSQIREYVEQKGAETLGVYFEYLPTGASIGVNSDKSFTEASLIKVPVAMAISRKIERDQIKGHTTLTLEKKDLDSTFGSLWQAGEGAQVSVDNAMYQMLTKSDNTASRVLRRNLTPEDIAEVYEQVDVEYDEVERIHTLTPFSYSSILKSLYFSSYISHEHSNKILEMLTQTPYGDRLVAGVSDSVKVAHKIGVFDTGDSEHQKYLVYSDCGIFYVPKRPYLLCVMDQNTEANARTHMKELSALIYKYITAVDR